MANKEMTRAQALDFAIEAMTTMIEWEDLVEEADKAIEVLRKMHAQVTKPRKKSDTPSKARIINEGLANKCVAAMEGHDKVMSKWLIEHVNGLLTPQKTTAVMKIAIEDGRVTKSKEGKSVYYSLAE